MRREPADMTDLELFALLVEHLVYCYQYKKPVPRDLIAALSLAYMEHIPPELSGLSMVVVRNEVLARKGTKQ